MFLVEGLHARFHLPLLTEYSTNRFLFNERMDVGLAGMWNSWCMPCLELGTCVDTTRLTKDSFKDIMPCPQLFPSYHALFLQQTDYMFPNSTVESLFLQ